MSRISSAKDVGGWVTGRSYRRDGLDSVKVSLGPADRSHLPAAATAAEEPIAAIGLQPRDAHAGRHFYPLQNLAGSGIDFPQVALVTFPGGMPKLALDPGDPGDEAAAFDGAKNFSCCGIDLKNLPLPILPHPQRAFRPGEPRVAAGAGRRDGR